MSNLAQIEQELQRRVREYPPTPWRRKQSNDWDQATNFIYGVAEWDALRQRIATLPETQKNYAVNRWFNFWSAMAVERIFCQMPGVTPHRQKDKLIDFSIHGIQFDHKTTVFPQKYERTARYAYFNRCHLIDWLYRHQSQQGRHHLGNRLFIVLYAVDGEHWKLRADVAALSRIIQKYVTEFDPDNLTSVAIDGAEAQSDLIWYVKDAK